MEEEFELEADFVVTADPLHPADTELLRRAQSVAICGLKGSEVAIERTGELLSVAGEFRGVQCVKIADCQLDMRSWEAVRGFLETQKEEVETVEISDLEWHGSAAVQSLLSGRFKHDGLGEYREALVAFEEKLEQMSARNEDLVRTQGRRIWHCWQEVVLSLRRLRRLRRLSIRKSHLNMIGKFDTDHCLEASLPSVDEAVAENSTEDLPRVALFPIFHGLDVLADQIRLNGCLRRLVHLDLSGNRLCDPAIARLVQTVCCSEAESLETLSFADNLISDCGFILTLACVLTCPSLRFLLDVRFNQISMTHPNMPPIPEISRATGNLTVLLQGNPGWPDEDGISMTTPVMTSEFEDPPVLVSPAAAASEAPTRHEALLRYLAEEAADEDEDEDEDDSDYVSSSSGSGSGSRGSGSAGSGSCVVSDEYM